MLVQTQMDNESLFPTKIGVAFPKKFIDVAKTIFKRLFRVYAHIYIVHYETLMYLGAEGHLATSFKHFVLFVNEFDLVPLKEMAAMEQLVENILNNGPP